MSTLRKRPTPHHPYTPHPSDTHTTTPTLLGSTSSTTKPRLISLTTRKRILTISAFSISAFVLLPTSINMAFGSNLGSPATLNLLNLDFRVTSVLTFVVILLLAVYVGREVAGQNKERARVREEREYYRVVEESTYRCVRPQILGSMVVFPVVIVRRDAVRDRVMRVTDEVVRVELEQGGSSKEFEGADRDVGKKRKLEEWGKEGEKRVRDLFDVVINNKTPGSVVGTGRSEVTYLCRVFSGSRGGPTGMAVGVSYPGKGKDLAWEVGKRIEGVCPEVEYAPPK